MTATLSHRVLIVVGLLMIAFNTLVLTINGLFMLFVPKDWFFFVPGVTDTGFYNQHFVRDIGLIQIYLGVAFGVGVFWPSLRLFLWPAATVWLTAHAAFHIWEVAVGICAPSAIPRDFPAVSLPALIGMAVSIWAWRQKARIVFSPALA